MLLMGSRGAQDLKSPNILVDANWRIKVAVRARGLAPACRQRADRAMLCKGPEGGLLKSHGMGHA